jgi:hypothetical protein
LDASQGNESREGVGEVFIILGQASVSAEPRKGALGDPASSENDEALHFVGALDDLHVQNRCLATAAST